MADSDYIRRDDALDCFACDLGKKDRKISYQGFMVEAAMRIHDIPASDVKPVVRGRWNRYVHDKELWANYCSACNTYLQIGMDWEPNFCPNCGAHMRKETEHD